MKTLSLDTYFTVIGISISGTGFEETDSEIGRVEDINNKSAFNKAFFDGDIVTYWDGSNWLLDSLEALEIWKHPTSISYLPPENGWSVGVFNGYPPPKIVHILDAAINKDLHLDALGNLAIATDAEGLRQKLETRFRLYLGEWYLDISKGVPYIQRILGRAQGSNPALQNTIGQIFDNQALKEPEVLSVISSSSEFIRELRAYSYSVKLETIYGQLTLEV